MTDIFVEDAHSGWDDIMQFKRVKVERPLRARSPLDNITSSLGRTSALNEWNNYDKANTDSSQWS